MSAREIWPDSRARSSTRSGQARLVDKPGELALMVLDGSLAGQTFEFNGPKHVVIGRSNECEVELFDGRVSRRHCSIDFDGQLVQVKDLASANGTFLNGERVRLTIARAGDVLRVAEVRIR